MNRLSMRYGLSCLALVIAGVSTGPAQPARPPAPRRMPWAWLQLHFDPRGGVRASLQLPFQPPNQELWRQVFATILHTSTDQVREEQSSGWWTTLHAHADAVLQRSGWTIQGDLDLNALRALLDAFNVGQLVVSFEHFSDDFSECSLKDADSRRDLLNTSYSADLPVAEAAPPVHVAFGFRSESAWRFLPLAAVLLAPIGLTLWRRRPQPGEDDRFTAWFRYCRFQKWLLPALWGAWLLAVALLGGVGLAGFLLCGIFARGEFVWMALFLVLPPALAALACKVLSAPAFARVPEMEWTRGRLLRQGLWTQLGIAGMGVCLGCGADSLTLDHNFLGGFLYLLAACGLLVLGLAHSFLSRNNITHLLPPGPLRERLFELAEQVRVRVRQAYCLPPAAWRLLNAVGILDCAHVSAEVLPHLSRRETDALLALELARLWRRRRFTLWQMLGSFTLMLAMGVGLGILAAFVGEESIWPLMPFVFAVGLLGLFRQPGQHFMSRLDRDVLAITGDPEALITALAKLRRLHMLPLVAGEEQRTSGDSLMEWRRLQDLADRAGIPPERLQEILDGPGSGADHYPPLEAVPDLAPGADTRVFSREFKRRAYFQQTWTGVAVEIAVPALLAYLVQAQQWRGVVLALVYLAGLPLTILLRQVVVRRLAAGASRALQRGVREKLARDGLQPESWGGVSVSLSPHAEPRLYENFVIWDPGFLVLAGDRLCYLGDQTRFALERRHIQDVYLGPGSPGLGASRRVYVAWRDDERGVGGVFNLILNERGTWWRSGARQASLARRLRDWLKQPVATAQIPPPLRDLPAPDLGAVAGEAIGKFATGNTLLALLLLRAPFAIGACLLLGLSFDLKEGAAGWYVLGCTTLIEVWTVLSFLPHRRGEQDTGDKDALGHGNDPP